MIGYFIMFFIVGGIFGMIGMALLLYGKSPDGSREREMIYRDLLGKVLRWYGDVGVYACFRKTFPEEEIEEALKEQ